MLPKRLLAGMLLGVSLMLSAGSKLASVEIKSRAPKNRTVTVHYRVPSSYEVGRRESYRVLVMFGGRNTDGRADATGRLGWGKWCDENGVFIVSPGFTDDNYWEPQEWSGGVLLKALAEIKKEYNICTDKLLYYGYSAGSQCSNLFPAWRPEWARAWVSHACGVFHEPTTRMRGVPGLVTCGDADTIRYIISRNFVEKSRQKGVDIIWKSFPNHPHDVPPDSLKLARAFLGYYHELYRDDLSSWKAGRAKPMPVAFIGDDLEHKYYPADSARARNVLTEDRVPLPNQVIARAWGEYAE